MKRLGKALALVAALAALSADARQTSAARVAGSLGVQVRIAAHCFVDAQVASGGRASRGEKARGKATITTNCTCGSAPLISLSARGPQAGCAAVWDTDADAEAPLCGAEAAQSFTLPDRNCGDAVVANVTF